MRAPAVRAVLFTASAAIGLSCSSGTEPSHTATSLSFVAQPANAVRDTALVAPVKVAVLDQNGAVLTTATTAITLALGTNPRAATLSGTTTVAPVAGVATFSVLKLDSLGTGYTLVATASGLTGATSAPFNVTLSLADVDGDGLSPNAGDCNDADSTIHPGAVDVPDAAFVDKNCDGLDGDVAKAVFVAPTGSNTAACGTQASPCLTVDTGVAHAAAGGKRDVYIAAGTYNEVVTLADGVSLYGGFAANWTRGAGNVTTIDGADGGSGTGSATAVTIFVQNLTKAAVVADLHLVGPNATGQQGRNAYVVLVNGVAAGLLTITRNTIQAGNAANGATGTAGINAATLSVTAGMAGAPGDSAVQSGAFCDAITHGGGGAKGTNSPLFGTGSPNGGDGGAGGAQDTECSLGLPPVYDFTAQAGADGANASSNTFGGLGGAGGTGGGTCGATQAGADGAINNGTPGLGGVGGVSLGGYWVGGSGTPGAVGTHGGGGGGGGGAGGCDVGTDSYGAGGGGGGAGGGAAQSGGGGGGGGGGSFAIYLNVASPVISNNVIVRGNAGNGGAGGTGGQGQSGGAGGAGGKAKQGSAGGAGGHGAHGGHGGGGGGGAGGWSAGIFRTSLVSVPTLSGNTISGGALGFGGAGGLSAPNAPPAERDGALGNSGTDGVLGDVVTGNARIAR